MTALTLDRLDVPPTHGGTDRDPARPTLGGHVEAWHAILYGARFHPWQRFVADVVGELDDRGRRRYDVAVVDVMRQQGKTQWEMADATHSTRRGPGRVAVYTAQTRQDGRFKLLDEFADDVLAGNVFLSDRYKARRSNGSESIRWTDTLAARSMIAVAAVGEKAGHGLTKVDDVYLDEAWSHTDMTIVSGLLPTMTVAVDPQIKVVSTVGHGADGLLLHYEEIGAASLLDPDTTVAFFKWAADDDDDRHDPKVWRRIMPALGRSVTEARIRSFAKNMPAAEFERGFLNRRPAVASGGDVDLAAFAECAVDPEDDVAPAVDGIMSPAPPLVVAIDIAIDRTSSSIAAAGAVTVNGAGRLGVVVDRRPGTAWLVDELTRLAGTGTVAAFHGDRRAGAGGVIDAVAARGVLVDELDAGDVVTFVGTFVDELADRRLAHTSPPVLVDAAAGAKSRPLGDAIAWSKLGSPVDVAPLNAVSFAVGAHRRAFPLGVVHERIT